MRLVKGQAVGWTVVLVSLLLGILGVTTGTCLAAGVSFTDAPPADHWAASAVVETGEAEILIGYPDGSFQGDRAATRYELAMALSRLYRLVRGAMEKETVDPQDVARLADEVQKVQVALTQAEEQMAGSLQDFNDRLGDLEGRLAAVESKAEKVTTETCPGEAEVQLQLEALTEEMQRQMAEAEQRCLDRQTQLETALDSFRQSLAQTADQVVETVGELARLGQEDERLAAEQSELRQGLEALDRQLEVLEGQLADLSKSSESLAGRVQTLEGRTADLGQGMDGLRGRIEALEGRTGDLGQGMDGLRGRVEALERENQKLKQGMERMGWLMALGAAVLAVF
ncbi:MAG: S-layer homology domain-containing protein [Betaproteobacteria bacterium]